MIKNNKNLFRKKNQNTNIIHREYNLLIFRQKLNNQQFLINFYINHSKILNQVIKVKIKKF